MIRRFVTGGLAATALVLAGASPVAARTVVDPAAGIGEPWEEKVFGEPIAFSEVEIGGRPAIKARGTIGSSGLYRPVAIDLEERPILRWSWRAHQLPASTDISVADDEDFSVSLWLSFGEPGIFNDVPTLVYAWARTPQAVGAVVPSPRYPGRVRTIVVRNANKPLKTWITEERNVAKDFRRAYGEAPPGPIERLALFSDNDQTEEPLLAYYGKIEALPEAKAQRRD